MPANAFAMLMLSAVCTRALPTEDLWVERTPVLQHGKSAFISSAAKTSGGTCADWCATNVQPWATRCTFKACKGCVECVGPANQFEKLIPPQGMWRGVTLMSNDVAKFEKELGVKVQIYRTFKGDSSVWSAPLSEDEIAFVNNGGILMYSMQPKDWAAFGPSGNKDDIIKAYAAQVKSLAPAKVFVLPGYEPDGHALDLGAKKPYGTVAQYLEMYSHFREVWEHEDVTNAIWSMDYSVLVYKDITTAEKLWPGDDKVDWVFWNYFQKSNGLVVGDGLCSETIKVQYDLFESVTKSTLFNVPWGIGAWGSMDKCPWGGADPPPIKLSLRASCFEDMSSIILESGNYPKLKAAIYYNSLESMISPVAQEYKDGKYVTTTDAAVVHAFQTYLKSKPFTENDQYFTKSPTGDDS